MRTRNNFHLNASVILFNQLLHFFCLCLCIGIYVSTFIC